MKYMNMKRYRNILAMAFLAITSGFLFASCSSEDANGEKTATGKSPLKINVAGVATTKSFFEGNMLPDECEYYIFLHNDGMDLNNSDIPVQYAKGESRISRPVFITRESTVGAVYCDRNKVVVDGNVIVLNTTDQQDVLVAYSNVIPSYPEVSLMFKHIMSRVSLRITKSADNNRTYDKFGTAEVVDAPLGYYYLFSDKVTPINNQYTTLKVKPKDKSYIETATDVVEYDFLMLPQSSSGLKMNVNCSSFNSTINFSKLTLLAGNKYVLDAVIKGNDLEIQSVSVEPWASESHDISIEI